MGMFKNAIRGIINWAVNSDNSNDKEKSRGPRPGAIRASGLSVNTVSADIGDNGMNLTVYNASGGKIVKVYWYDDMVGRNNSSLHLITDGENFAEELAMIITKESLSR